MAYAWMISIYFNNQINANIPKMSIYTCAMSIYISTQIIKS